MKGPLAPLPVGLTDRPRKTGPAESLDPGDLDRSYATPSCVLPGVVWRVLVHDQAGQPGNAKVPHDALDCMGRVSQRETTAQQAQILGCFVKPH